MFNSRILLSAASIAAAGALVIGATFAYFSDTNSSTENVFASGTLDLQLDDNNESLSSANIAGSFGGTNLVPGGTPFSGFVSLHNNGTINASFVSLDVTETATSAPPDLAGVMNVTSVKTGSNNDCSTGATDLTSAWTTALGGSTPLTLAEVRDGSVPSLPALNVLDTYYLCMTYQIDSGADNTYQGESGTETFAFTANQ